MYRLLIRPLLFLLDPEDVHHLVFRLIRIGFAIPGIRQLCTLLYGVKDKSQARTLFGLTFPNPIGLAAGFDKNALIAEDWAAFGFGFIEIGTVTPLPQAGNPRPRLFRLPADQALINRMGFNNDGATAVANRLRNRRGKLIIGGNIGKNKDTPNDQAVLDYEKAFLALADHVDFITVNVSSPNTPNLRALQDRDQLALILNRLNTLNAERNQPRPILLKIAPDLTTAQLDDIVSIARDCHLAGLIATNTTISRDNLKTPAATITTIGAGGLSGGPLRHRSNEVIRYLRQQLGPDYPLIGVGGIMTPQDARDKLAAGADLVQVYTGFVYWGPGLAGETIKS